MLCRVGRSADRAFVLPALSDMEIQIFVDDKNVAVNFQGLDFDDSTFIKVDLVFDEASLAPSRTATMSVGVR